MSVRTSISAMSSWDSFTLKTHLKNQTAYNWSYSPLKAKKMVVTATSLSCRVPVYAICAFCWPTTETPSITNSLVTIVHTKPVIAIFVSKLVAIAMTLRHSICLHRIAWPRKPTPRIKYCATSYHTTKVITHRKPKKWLTWQCPLVAGYRKYLHFVGWSLKLPP